MDFDVAVQLPAYVASSVLIGIRAVCSCTDSSHIAQHEHKHELFTTHTSTGTSKAHIPPSADSLPLPESPAVAADEPFCPSPSHIAQADSSHIAQHEHKHELFTTHTSTGTSKAHAPPSAAPFPLSESPAAPADALSPSSPIARVRSPLAGKQTFFFQVKRRRLLARPSGSEGRRALCALRRRVLVGVGTCANRCLRRRTRMT